MCPKGKIFHIIIISVRQTLLSLARILLLVYTNHQQSSQTAARCHSVHTVIASIMPPSSPPSLFDLEMSHSSMPRVQYSAVHAQYVVRSVVSTCSTEQR